MLFKGTRVNTADLREARIGATYFLVREGRVHPRRTAPKATARLQTLPPARLGVVEGFEGPAVRRRLLGAVKIVGGRAGKRVQPLTQAEERVFLEQAKKRAGALGGR